MEFWMARGIVRAAVRPNRAGESLPVANELGVANSSAASKSKSRFARLEGMSAAQENEASMSKTTRGVPTKDQRAIAATVVQKVVGHSIDGTVLWGKWVREISQAIADAAWSDPYVGEEIGLTEGGKL
jgi:hypothetical protein